LICKKNSNTPTVQFCRRTVRGLFVYLLKSR